MIYPRLNRVRNGQHLSVELVNGLIKRTEYAADLLRQGKCLAGTDIRIDAKYTGTILTATGFSFSFNRYSGYILPLVPSVNDILLELDVPVSFEGGELGGLFARDLPLDQRLKIVYPEFVLNGTYALIISGAYWANFNTTPNALGFYVSISAPIVPPFTFIILGGQNGYPPLGPHPNAGVLNSSFFEQGSIMLIKLD